MYRFYFIFVSCIISINACNEDLSRNHDYEPSNYLKDQRFFPYGHIDPQAYRSAVLSLNEFKDKSNTGFSEAWLSRGPKNISGRVTDIEMHHTDTMTIYVGTASGGILKSTDQGLNWKPIFDQQASLSIGDIALSPADKNVIIAGTGEANAGGSSVTYDGLGLFRSDDGGENWEYIGLEESGSIGRIIFHPYNDNIIYVAAMGQLFSNNKQRGVFKTTDGGSSWQHILSISDSTGAIDLVIHPENPDTLFAAMWERKRGPGSRVYGGSTSGLYRSYDGGQNWIELKGGLPEQGEQKGRIGIAISQSHPDIIFAYYADARGNLQGIYRSGDGGDNWISKSLVNINNVPFTWWFGRIYVHPNNPDKVFVTGLNMFASEDGGDSWQRIFYDAHIDHHAFYTHPAVPDFYIDGNDGGIDISYDGGLTHYNVKALENIQFYTCTADPSNPDVIYGGTQDNGILSTRGEADQWNYLWGGDGFSVLVDPLDNNRIMVQVARGHVAVSSDGGLSFEDRVSGLEGFFNWNAPLAPDPANPDRIYTASQSLYVTENWGVEWSALSPQILQPNVGEGGVVTGTFSALDISSVDEQSICLGTDHGEVWLSRDGGFSFMNITHNLPRRWITSVKFDKWSTGIYVTLSGFRFGEMTSHVFYSDNEGINWLPVAEELPDIPVNDIMVDDVLEDHLYVATDIGVFYSPDKGESWNKLGSDMPVVPVCDLDKTKESRLLYAATFGKGVYSYELPMTTSLQTLPVESPSIYPNPTSGVVYLPDHNKFKSIIVFNMQGQSKTSFPSSPVLNLSGLNQGVYILQLSDQETVINYKIVIYH